MEMSKLFHQIRGYARSKHLPLIPIEAKDITLIHEPDSFYKRVLSSIENAESKVALSALYLGTGHKEKNLVKTICKKLKQNDNFNVHMVLDANRATRMDERVESSVTVLRELLSFKNFNLDLIKSNKGGSIINRFVQRFQKWNELSATYHAKLLVFDDNVMITGANLSGAYFDQRQDRYMLLKNSNQLSSYMTELLHRIANNTDSLKPSIHNMNVNFIKQLTNYNVSSTSKAYDSYVIPLIQHLPSGITDLNDFLRFLDSVLPPSAQVHLSSGYFNPSTTISEMKINSVIAPSEEANGFYRGKGVLRHVPRLYSALHRHYIQTHRDCQLFLYDKPDWSYHGKGIWVEGVKDIYIHLIGSSNFNCRSSERDLEAQLVILTSDKHLIQQLRKEYTMLRRETTLVEKEQLPSLYSLYSLVSRIIRSYL